MVAGMSVNISARWRDRGKAPELEPPPYEQGDWVPSRVFNFYHPQHSAV